MRNGEGPGDCESGVFRAEKADVVGGKKNRQMPQHFAVFGSHYDNPMGSIAR
jgi:hypothetical protein